MSWPWPTLWPLRRAIVAKYSFVVEDNELQKCRESALAMRVEKAQQTYKLGPKGCLQKMLDPLNAT